MKEVIKILKELKKEMIELNKSLSSIRTFIIANAQLTKKSLFEQQKTNLLIKNLNQEK